jgi:hypothetical protein
MPAHTGRLILTEQDPFRLPDEAALRTALDAVGLIAGPLPDGEAYYATGPRFLELVVFAGCAVRLELSPRGDGGPFCHVRLLGPYTLPRFLGGRNTRPPRCPSCRAPLKGWAGAALGWDRSAEQPLACPACGARASAFRWDWKEGAGFGRLLLSIEEVFPGEAVPTPALLDLLTRTSGRPWRYFYAQDP